MRRLKENNVTRYIIGTCFELSLKFGSNHAPGACSSTPVMEEYKGGLLSPVLLHMDRESLDLVVHAISFYTTLRRVMMKREHSDAESVS